jgi:hypothetical protein
MCRFFLWVMKTPTTHLLQKSLATVVMVVMSAATTGNSHHTASDHGNSGGNTPKKPKNPEKITEVSAAPTANGLALAIASDVGGQPKQYAYYAENLEETLSRLSPAQRARVFGGR